jgi:hypothetical protein
MQVRHAVAVATAAAIAAGGTGVAIGQGAGGPPAGTFTFDVRIPHVQGRSGINPAVPRNKKRPVVADLSAASADVLVGGKKVGLGHHTEVTTYSPGKKYRGKGVWSQTDVYDFGGGNVLFMSCIAEDSPTANLCAVTGGTGRYAGARGTAVEAAKPVKETKRVTVIRVDVAFMP